VFSDASSGTRSRAYFPEAISLLAVQHKTDMAGVTKLLRLVRPHLDSSEEIAA
jgi:hypothetical protein